MTVTPAPPDAVVRAFIAAMNAWELASWKRSREFRGTDRAAEHWPQTSHALAEVGLAR